MKIKTGYLYHIKDEFFDIANDENLMTNHERGKARPTYFTIKDKNILWFIPLSSKVEKYKKIVDKTGCDSATFFSITFHIRILLPLAAINTYTHLPVWEFGFLPVRLVECWIVFDTGYQCLYCFDLRHSNAL